MYVSTNDNKNGESLSRGRGTKPLRSCEICDVTRSALSRGRHDATLACRRKAFYAICGTVIGITSRSFSHLGFNAGPTPNDVLFRSVGTRRDDTRTKVLRQALNCTCELMENHSSRVSLKIHIARQSKLKLATGDSSGYTIISIYLFIRF